jgi:hypothetical protein
MARLKETKKMTNFKVSAIGISIFVAAFVVTPLTVAFAAEAPVIGLHLECAAGEADCQEYPDGFDKIIVRKKPDVVLSPETLLEFYFTPGESGRDVASLTLTASEAEKLKVLTTANRHKRLAIVIGGKVSSAPVIQSAISDRMQITFGQEGPDQAFKDVPWALEMAKKTKSSNEVQNLTEVVSYLLIALILIGGSVYVAFIRGRKQSEEAV